MLLVSNEMQTTRIFNDAVLAAGVELIALEDSGLAERRIRDEKFDGIFVDTALPKLNRPGFTHLVRTSKFNSQAPRRTPPCQRAFGAVW